MYFGPTELLVNLDVQFDEELTALEIEEAVLRLESRIRAQYPEVARIFIEVNSLREKVPAEEPV